MSASEHEKARVAFDALYKEFSRLLPGARIEHVGGTSIPGVPTKGDLDVQIIVGPGDFSRAKDLLVRRFETNPGAFSSKESWSFKDDKADPPLGIHLTVFGCPDDIQWRFREVLLKREDLRDEYAGLKRKCRGKSIKEYQDEKEKFFDQLKETQEYRTTF